jgi:pimeloyl-ACP methyl ester carboxylesterase
MSTWFVPIEAIDDGLAMRRTVERLAEFGRVVMFDRRGVGLSDPILPGSPPTLEEWSSDALAVGEAVGLSSAVVLGLDPSGAQVAMYMAATHPEAVGTMILFNATGRSLSAADYPIGLDGDHMRERIERNVESFITGDAGFGLLAPAISEK